MKWNDFESDLFGIIMCYLGFIIFRLVFPLDITHFKIRWQFQP